MASHHHNRFITFFKKNKREHYLVEKKERRQKKITYRGCPMTLFGPDVVRSQLVAVSHHSTEKDVKKHELFDKKKKRR